ncbi:MAG: bile acid:sodium symporter family protein [Planctomycetaceae bacterium]
MRYTVFVLLVAASGLAVFWPRLNFSVDPFVSGKPVLPWLVVTAMLAIGSLLPADEVQQILRRWPEVVGGTAAQYTLMPLLAFLSVRIFQFDDDLAAGVMIAGCVPGAMASNVLTLQARGNVSYSVSLTTLATLLSPIVVPLALGLTIGSTQGYDGTKAIVTLLWQVVLPVTAGYLLSRCVPVWHRATNAAGTYIANAAILAIIAVVVGLQRDALVNVSASLLTALLLLNLLGYAGGFLAGHSMKLPGDMRRALTLEVGMQNAGVGSVLAVQIFGSDSRAAIPCALYTFGCMFTGTVLATLWRGVPIKHCSQPPDSG